MLPEMKEEIINILNDNFIEYFSNIYLSQHDDCVLDSINKMLKSLINFDIKDDEMLNVLIFIQNAVLTYCENNCKNINCLNNFIPKPKKHVEIEELYNNHFISKYYI